MWSGVYFYEIGVQERMQKSHGLSYTDEGCANWGPEMHGFGLTQRIDFRKSERTPRQTGPYTGVSPAPWLSVVIR